MNRNLIISILTIFLLFNCKKSVAEKIETFIDKNNTDVLIFSKFTDFEWDYLWITTTRDIETVKSTMQEKNIDSSYLEKLDILKKRNHGFK
ncbi:hypothetical protein [uncultured Apibacter sp.]|uniref:hypothetical protein n=1 Tax=uncultured Apibacter sp. TaxID=1778616 RepID=UPI0025EE30DC|nr:hypothetical protein [uncultured Apibacter sp.]